MIQRNSRCYYHIDDAKCAISIRCYCHIDATTVCT